MNAINLLFAAFFCSTLFTFLTHLLFYRSKKFDAINIRSSHCCVATCSGGSGIILSVLGISLYYYFNDIVIYDYSLMIPLGIMFITGIYDDFYNADFKIKFFLQIIVAKILIDQGYVIDHFHGVFGLNEIPWFAAQVFTIFVFLVITNAINFIDGIDGLAISMMLFILINYLLFVDNSPLHNFAFLCIGSLIPLFYFNFKQKKKVFLGDGGSLLLGTVSCVLMFDLLAVETTLKIPVVINKAYLSILILAYPLMDVLRIFIIRIGCKRSPFLPDSNHLHHLLLKKVKSHALTTLIIVICSLLFLGVHLLAAPYINDIYLVVFDIVFLLASLILSYNRKSVLSKNRIITLQKKKVV